MNQEGRNKVAHIIMSGEGNIGNIKHSFGGGGTIDPEYTHTETEDFGIETEIASKMRAIGGKTKDSYSVDRSEALNELRMRPRDYNDNSKNLTTVINSSNLSSSPLHINSFRDQH